MAAGNEMERNVEKKNIDCHRYFYSRLISLLFNQYFGK